jgi:hypothetical protein
MTETLPADVDFEFTVARLAKIANNNNLVGLLGNSGPLALRLMDETVASLQALLHAKGVTLFALIDHSGEAAKVGMQMPNTKLLIFGNPKGGTPLLQAAPSSAIDLPLKILVAEDGQGNFWIS